MGNLSDGTQTIVDAIRASTESRHNRLRELAEDAHNLLERHDLEHRDMGRALRERLSVAYSELRSDVHNLLERYDLEHGELRSNTRRMLDEVASDLGGARQIWGGLKKSSAWGRL